MSKWNEVKDEIQKTWSLLTHDEIEKAKGSLHSLAGALQKRYGMARHEAVERLSHFVDRLSKADPLKAETTKPQVQKREPPSENKKQSDQNP